MSLTGDASASTEVATRGNSHAHIRNEAIHILMQNFALLLETQGAFVSSTAEKSVFREPCEKEFLGEKELDVYIVPHFGNRTISRIGDS
jgi:hypothetical protein